MEKEIFNLYETLKQQRTNCYSLNEGWIRDLLRECVESNPGPSLFQIKNKLMENIGDDFPETEWNQFILDLKSTSNERFPNETTVLEYLDKHADKVVKFFGSTLFHVHVRESISTLVKGSSGSTTTSTNLVSEIATAVGDVVRNILKEDELSETSLSKMTLTKANALLGKIGVVVVELALEDVVINKVPFKPFIWPSDAENDDNSKAASNHLKEQLQSQKLIGRGKFELHAVHKDKNFFSTQIGLFYLHGGVDAVIVPHKSPPYSCSNVVRVVIDWKTPNNISFDSIRAQAFGELLAASVSQHPVLAIFTDLNTKFHIFQIVGSELHILRDLTIQNGFSYLVTYLKNSSPDSGFDMRTLKEQIPALKKSVEGAMKVKEHHPEHPIKTQLESLIDFDEPSHVRYEVASSIIQSWSLMYN